MSSNDNKLISLEHLSIVKQYVDDKCGDISKVLLEEINPAVEKNAEDIITLKNTIDGINVGGGASNEDLQELKDRIGILENCTEGFDDLPIGEKFDSLDARIYTLENKTSNEEGTKEPTGTIDEATLIGMINSDTVLNDVLKVGGKFGDGVINFIKDNGKIKSSNIEGSIAASKLSGTIDASKLSGTIATSLLPNDIPFSKIATDSFGATVGAGNAIKSGDENEIWKLNGDGSGQITDKFSWNTNGDITISNGVISWSHLADESIPDDMLNKIREQLGRVEGNLEMENLINNYLGDSIGYRSNENGVQLKYDVGGDVKTTATDLLGDKIGVFEYDSEGKVKTTKDANGNVIPVVTTVSNVIGDVTGAKAVYNLDKLSDIEYDKEISVASKFKEIEKNWIGESFKPEFEIKTVNGVATPNQTTQTVSDVFNEIKIDWLGESLKPVYAETNGVKTRKSQNVEDILNELKTKWLGEVIDETNGNSIKLGVVHNADGTVTNNQSTAEIFNEMQVDWLGTGFKPSRDSNLIRTSQTVYDVIKEIKQEWLGGDISKSKSVASIVDNLSNNISTNTKNITATTNTLNSHIAGYNTTIGNINTLIEAMRGDIQECDNRINAVNQSLFSSLTKEQVTNIINAAIQEGGLGETIATKNYVDTNFWTITNHDDYVDAHDQTHLTRDQIININELVNYLSITDTNTLNSMLNAAGVTSTQWYESIKNAILAITDGRYAESSTQDALSSYLTKSDASNTYLTQSKATSDYLTKSDASNTYLTQSKATSDYLTKSDASNTYLKTSTANSTYLKTSTANSTYLTKSDASSTYVPLYTYNQLAAKYDQLKDDYNDLLARVVALEAKVQ